MKLLKQIFTFGKNSAYKEAINYYNRCMYYDAIECFEKILQGKKSSKSLRSTLSKFYCGQAYRNLGEICFATGDYVNAARLFTKALEYNPNNVELYQYLGISYGNLNDLKKANDAFTKVMQQAPTSLDPRSKLGVVFYHLGIWDNAESTFKKKLEEQPGYAEIHYYLGLSYLGKGDAESASRSFKKAFSINPAYSKAKIKFCISQAYLRQFDDALDILLMEIEKFPNRADLHYIGGIIYAAGNDIEKSIAGFKQAISINPTYRDARIKLGILLCRLNRMDEGIRELEEACRLAPEDKAMITTLETLKKVCMAEDQCPGGKEGVCQLVSGEGRIDSKGLGEFINYFAISPNFADMLSILKKLPQSDAFLLDQLFPILKETIELHPGYSDIHNSLGTFYLKVGKYDKAIESFQEASKINPNYYKARINLFTVLKEKGNLESALDEGRGLLEEDLPYPDFMCAVGEVYLSIGNFEEALKVVEKALENNPKFAAANFLLAQIYHKRGENDKSVDTLKKCLDDEVLKK